MAMIDISQLSDWSAALAPLAGWPDNATTSGRPGLLSRLWDRFRARRAQHQTLRLLNSLDPATLRELGISPRELESYVYGNSEDRLRRYDTDWWRK